MAGGDRFDRVYEVKVVEEKGLKGNYMNLKISMHGYPSDALWKDAEQMYTLVRGGELTTDRDKEERQIEGSQKTAKLGCEDGFEM